MKIQFTTSKVEGNELIMDTSAIDVTEIRFNINTREITLKGVTEPKYTDLDGLSWQAVKKLVEENNGTWTNKHDGLDFLYGL